MRSFILRGAAFTALLAVPAVAGSTNVLAMQLAKIMQRQGGGFVPDTTTKTSCDSNELECGRDLAPRPTCYNPSIGQSCCSDGHACPEDSFCLFAPYCCPNGLSPEECAAQNGVTLPPDFSSIPSAQPTASPTAVPTGSSSVLVDTSSAPYPTHAPTETVVVNNNETAYTSAPPALFTGAANVNSNADIRGLAAVALGALGLLGYAL